MSTKTIRLSTLCSLFVALAASSVHAQLYTENFDDGNAVSRWTANAGIGFDASGTRPMDTNFDTAPFTGVDGVNDDFSGFMFDYGAAGVPQAPNSTGSATVGLKLQASLFSAAAGGFSASPNSLNLTGDYTVTFDAWSSTVGPFPGGGSGSTNLSTFGILTEGTTSQTLLSSDGVFFAYTGDGGSGADYRAYSVEQSDSYNLAGVDGEGNPVPAEPNATYFAVDDNGDPTRNAPGDLYGPTVGTANEAPQSVKDAFPGADLSGALQSGAPAFAWQEHEIRYVGGVADWIVNGEKLISIDTNGFSTPTLGGNLSFGHSDINFSSSTDLLAPDLLFTLIDNIEVNAVTASSNNADFDGSGNVDGEDFLTWQANDGAVDAQLTDGDANTDTFVNGDDLTVWQDQYGPVPAGISAVPEPSSLVLLSLSSLIVLRRRR